MGRGACLTEAELVGQKGSTCVREGSEHARLTPCGPELPLLVDEDLNRPSDPRQF